MPKKEDLKILISKMTKVTPEEYGKMCREYAKNNGYLKPVPDLDSFVDVNKKILASVPVFDGRLPLWG